MSYADELCLNLRRSSKTIFKVCTALLLATSFDFFSEPMQVHLWNKILGCTMAAYEEDQLDKWQGMHHDTYFSTHIIWICIHSSLLHILFIYKIACMNVNAVNFETASLRWTVLGLPFGGGESYRDNEK